MDGKVVTPVITHSHSSATQPGSYATVLYRYGRAVKREKAIKKEWVRSKWAPTAYKCNIHL